MRFSYVVFLTGKDGSGAGISESDREWVRGVLHETPRLSRALIYTPERASDLFNDDGAPPPFGFQLYFEELEALEAALAPNGALQALATLPTRCGLEASQQAFVNRTFAVPEPRPEMEHGCSYVVHYPGPAKDYNAWIAHYLNHHPPIMRRFPGIRELEILTRVDWRDSMPWKRAAHMQRNRVMFDSAEALTAALHAPVRHEMRADFTRFPAYEGGNLHYPMATRIVRPDP